MKKDKPKIIYDKESGVFSIEIAQGKEWGFRYSTAGEVIYLLH
jgi:hypothetical protein